MQRSAIPERTVLFGYIIVGEFSDFSNLSLLVLIGELWPFSFVTKFGRLVASFGYSDGIVEKCDHPGICTITKLRWTLQALMATGGCSNGIPSIMCRIRRYLYSRIAGLLILLILLLIVLFADNLEKF